MRIDAIVATLAVAAVAGALGSTKPDVGLLIIGIALSIVLALVLPLDVIVNLVIVASFLSRLEVHVVGFHVRPEHVTALLLFLKILLTHEKQRIGSAGTRAVLALAGIVLLSVIATVVNSPNAKSSFDIVGWLFMDVVLLWSLLQVPEAMLRRALLRTGLFSALVMAVLAIVFWGIAEAHGPLIGVQPDTAYGGYAAYVGSYEANIAAGLLVLWGLIALASLKSSGSVSWVNRAAAIMCPIALIATDTRAAIIAYLLGVVILAVRGGVLRWRHIMMGTVILALGVTFLSLSNQSGSVSRTSHKLANFSFTEGDGGLRTQSWADAFHDMGEEQALIGLGTNTFGQRHLDPTQPGKDVPWYLSAAPLQILYDAGGIAVLCMSFVLLAALPKERRARSLGYAMIAAYLLISMATSPIWFSFTWIFVAFGVMQRKGTVGIPDLQLALVERSMI
jgi:hypothetical protein